MRVHQLTLTEDYCDSDLEPLSEIEPQLLLAFGHRAIIEKRWNNGSLKKRFPNAIVAGCSTAGEISKSGVSEQKASLTAVHFDKGAVKLATVSHRNMQSSHETGERLAKKLPNKGLRAVLIYSVGLNINGSALIAGIRQQLPADVVVTGGLAADGPDFQKTLVIADEHIAPDIVVAIGLYGDVEVHCGSQHGWEIFGPMRKVTKCDANVLKELDGAPALELYRKYLGEYASDLPASALLFPLKLIDNSESSSGVIRTVLGIDENEDSLILAGEILEGAYVQMMHASVDQLIDGAEDAAYEIPNAGDSSVSLAILVSCVGRYLVMGDESDAEVSAVRDILGNETEITGFYSYGEINTNIQHKVSQLNNQTMTVTRIRETS